MTDRKKKKRALNSEGFVNLSGWVKEKHTEEFQEWISQAKPEVERITKDNESSES